MEAEKHAPQDTEAVITMPMEREGTLYDLEDPSLYINRELSLLEFQRRVLEEAEDETTPLLERVKFLSIVGSNLDEFFMVRLGGIKLQVGAGVLDVSPDGLTPTEQYAAIRKASLGIMQEAQSFLQDRLLPELSKNGIHLLSYGDLTDKQQVQVEQYFHQAIFPVLTPMAFDPGHPFPHISNLSLNLAVLIRDQEGRQHFARVKVPGSLPRFIPLKRSSGGVRKDGTVPYHHYFVWIEDVISAHLQALFPGMEVVESHPFRVTRNADFEIQELEAADLLETMEQSVRQRRFGEVVRVTVNRQMPAHVRAILLDNLVVSKLDCYILDGRLGLSSLMSLYGSVERHDLREQPFVPLIPKALRAEKGDIGIFDAISQSEYLLHQPYDSFVPVLNFLDAAATDPDVLAIKMTLYRVGRNAPVVKSLLRARENGKQVAVLVELKARFDEESNIGWAKTLEREGVHVIYGLLGLKTHSKIALVVRKEGEHLKRYVHLSTGNYNAVTAHLYEDLGFFTTDEEIGADASDLFNYLTGYSAKTDYRKLLVAPISLRQRMEGLIEREIDHAHAGRPARMILKTNSMVDKTIIQCLYRASQAGVEADLLVRGVCCLRPGVPGLSERVTVYSIVGRFLEHSRIYYFLNGGDPEIYLGSADLMPRNLDRRVELLFPLEDPALIQYVYEKILLTYLQDNVKARVMQANGTYVRRPQAEGAPARACQSWFLERRHKKVETDKHPWEVI